MREMFLAGAGILMQAVVFYAVGSLCLRILRLRQEASLSLVFGYVTYFAVFELFAVPMTLAKISLTGLALVWAVVIALAVAASLVLGILDIKRKHKVRQYESVRNPGGIWQQHSWMLILVILVVLLQCVIVVLYQDTTVDAAYYVGTVSTSVYTDSLWRYNPYTGDLMTNFSARYIFSAYPMNNAVWCRLLGIPALIQCKVVMSVIHVWVANLVIYQIGKRLFNGGRKQADLMVCLVCLMQLFSYTIYTTGTFFFTRTYEGKAILGNVSIPMVLYCSVWLWQEIDSKAVWAVLFMTVLSALTFSGSSIIFPAVVAAGILPVILMKRRPGKLIPCAVCMIPVLLYGAVFLATRVGILTLAVS